MRSDASSLLAPDVRALYSDSLRPPPGYVFDGGIATTFSLNLETLLTIPVYLALYSVPDVRDAFANPVAILEAIERTSQKLAVFVQGGCIHAVEKQPRLCGLLESMTVEVSAPRGGTFHPKLWLLRFKSQYEAAPLVFRLLVLSRNLTNDRSWDVVLRLEGHLGRRNVAANNPLARLIAGLPDLALRPDVLTPKIRELTHELAEQALRTTWELPDGFEELTFETVGFGRRSFLPDSDRLAVISPYCDEKALQVLADTSRKPDLLLSRWDTLVALPNTILARFDRVCVLQDAAETEDGEESEQIERLYGLHAKIYLLDRGWYTTLVIGSGNATTPVFKRGDNVELFALLTGRRSKVGSVESLFDPEGLGGMIIEFVPPAEPPVGLTAAELQADKDLEHVRVALLAADLRLHCVEAGYDGELPSTGVMQSHGRSWRASLTATQPLAFPGIRSLSIWLVTARKEQARDGMPLATQYAVDLGVHPLAGICGFVAFELAATAAERSITFALNIPVVGLPAHRDRAILRSVIESSEGLLRYLRLLLADLDGFPLTGQIDGAGSADWRVGSADGALLEDLIRALSRDPERTLAVDRLLERLEDPTDNTPVVPPDFLALWTAFRPLLPKRENP